MIDLKEKWRLYKKILKVLCIIVLVWFVVYFSIGKEIPLEFSNYKLSQSFGGILVFLSGVAIYLLFILWIKLKREWHFSNILKFFFGLLLSIIPLIIYAIISYDDCNFWQLERVKEKELYYSRTYYEEKIIEIEYKCPNIPEGNFIIKVQRRPLSPLFNIVKKVNVDDINPVIWTKIDE